MISAQPYIFLDDQITGHQRLYTEPVEMITAFDKDEVFDALEQLQKHHEKGHYLAGYMAYEMGYALESKLNHRLAPSKPLICFGIFKDYSNVEPDIQAKKQAIHLSPLWSEEQYLKRFEKVIAYIQAGDVYQINLTFPMTGEFNGDPLELYLSLRDRQPVHYGGVISLCGPDIVSFSPELFFRNDKGKITLRPMKGTAKRLPDPKADKALLEAMRQDAKSQAENLMIVDLLRNDVSRIAQKASVRVPELFSLETYPTLHQMTSTVTAQLKPETSITELFKSLFPCGSVTGAPKIRAMEIIDELEDVPRGPYCGSVGYIDPDGDSCFNVAIRTAMIENGKVTYHVGSGVVLDSDGAAEYAECLLKAKVFEPKRPDLIETFRWTQSGVIRRDKHLARLKRSAKDLGYPLPLQAIKDALSNISAAQDQRVRLSLNPWGEFHIQTEDYAELNSPLKLSLSQNPLTPNAQDSRHKISHRAFYDGERKRLQKLTGCDEVLFLNEQHELCEGSFTNLFIEKSGQLLTPKLSCGLLAGVLREELIETRKALETILTLEDLKSADKIFVGNSLRGLIKAEIMGFQAL